MSKAEKEKRITVRQQKILEDLTRMQCNRLIKGVREAARREEFESLPDLVSLSGYGAMGKPENYPAKYRAKVRKIRKLAKEFNEEIDEENEIRKEKAEKVDVVARQLVNKMEQDRDERIIAIAFIDASDEVKKLLESLPKAEDVMADAKKIGLELDKKQLPASSGVGAYSPHLKNLLDGK